MDLSRLEELLNRKNQRFICCDTGWPKPGPERHTAQITHVVTPPMTATELAQLKTQMNGVDQLVEFYGKYGSVRLYCDTIGDASAFYIAHPDEWEELRGYFQGWLEELDESEEAELLPKWLDDYVVFGEVPQSGNYFLMPVNGEEKGKVFEFEHDGFEFIERAPELQSFVATISIVTDELINEILAHTRYSDGKTETQWLAEKYEFER